MYQELRVNLRAGIPAETIVRNINHAISLGLPAMESQTESGPLAIVAGGPSLSLYSGGMTTMALNGACGVVRCDYAVCYDPGEQNVAFFKGDLCRGAYLIGSRVDPSVFRVLEGRDVRLWHYDDAYERSIDLRPRYSGGPAVGLTGLVLASDMGFDEFHLYGYDSCLKRKDGKLQHHAYDQPWNDRDAEMAIDVIVEGREFTIAPWHRVQLEYFEAIWRFLKARKKKVVVYGDGLLAWAVELLEKRFEEFKPARVEVA